MRRECIKCGSERVHRSRVRKGERTLSKIFLRPLHCHACKTRYWVPYKKAYFIVGMVSFCSFLLAYFAWINVLAPGQSIVRSQQLEAGEITLDQITEWQGSSETDLILKNPTYATTPEETEVIAEISADPALTKLQTDNRFFMVQLYYEKARKGDAAAQYQLGLLYLTGNGAIQDFEEAARWFELAAEKNHALAQYELGMIYKVGYGVAADLEKSYMWLNLAAAAGIDEAALMRNKIMLSLNSEQLTQAQRASRERLGNMSVADR